MKTTKDLVSRKKDGPKYSFNWSGSYGDFQEGQRNGCLYKHTILGGSLTLVQKLMFP